MKKFLKNIKNKKLLFFIVFVLVVIPISTAIGTIELRMQTEWPVAPGGASLDPGSTITDLARYIYEWGIALGGIVAFVALLIAGFAYMTSVGDPGKMKEAMDRIKSAILGLTLLLGSWLILHTINPELTTFRPIKFAPEDVPGIQIPEDKKLTEALPCKKAIFFSGPNFTGNTKTMDVGDQKTIRRLGFRDDRGDIVSPLSFVMCREIRCRDIRKGEEVVENQLGAFGCPENQIPLDRPRDNDMCQTQDANLIEGGACSLQIFDGDWLPWVDLGCGGPVVELFSPRIRNFANLIVVENIKCLELVEQTF